MIEKFILNDYGDSLTVRLDSALGDEVILAPDGFSGIGLILIDGVVHIDFKSGGEDWSFPIDKD